MPQRKETGFRLREAISFHLRRIPCLKDSNSGFSRRMRPGGSVLSGARSSLGRSALPSQRSRRTAACSPASRVPRASPRGRARRAPWRAAAPSRSRGRRPVVSLPNPSPTQSPRSPDGTPRPSGPRSSPNSTWYFGSRLGNLVPRSSKWKFISISSMRTTPSSPSADHLEPMYATVAAAPKRKPNSWTLQL